MTKNDDGENVAVTTIVETDDELDKDGDDMITPTAAILMIPASHVNQWASNFVSTQL